MLTARQGLLAFAVGCATIVIGFFIAQHSQANQAAAIEAALVQSVHDANRTLLFKTIILEGEMEQRRRRQTEKMFDDIAEEKGRPTGRPSR